MARSGVAGRILRQPITALRLLRALLIGAGPQFGRQARRLGGEAFARDLAWALLADEGAVEVAVRRDGMVWRTDLGDEIGLQLFRSGTYEGEEIAAVLRWLRREGRTGVVVDVGANIGTTTVPFARAGFRVIAVEPVPSTHALLVANVAASGHADRVTTVPVAVAEATGEVEMWVGDGSGQSEVVVPGVAPDGAGGEPRTVVVRAAPLGDVLTDHGVEPSDVALVWADVQGSETAVITGADALWPAGVPVWLEVDPGRLHGHGGLDVFLDAVAERFTAFISRDALLAGEGERPISGFAAWARSIPDGRYSDALLVARPG
jgi:FkbM family methyltransferase